MVESSKSVVFTDITNHQKEEIDESWQLAKREKFAVSLRKEKKKLILSKKRQNLFLKEQTESIIDLNRHI